ncbi:hypothetical protein MNBD_GAMMA11-897 [hydrothermal vent metagenome]|uniref:Uncharacterized protein n=1 Tax=hydrothermal vent metagenome TaxID=652676 RepID=A0A3B0X1P3_9ZZZZ
MRSTDFFRLKEEVKKENNKISKLESELKNDRKRLDELRESFDPDASVNELAEIRGSIKSQTRNLTEIESLREDLSTDSSADQLYVAAVSIRETRAVKLLSDLFT